MEFVWLLVFFEKLVDNEKFLKVVLIFLVLFNIFVNVGESDERLFEFLVLVIILVGYV